MKNSKLFAVALVCMVLSPLTSSADNLPISANLVPVAAPQFAPTVPGLKIAYAKAAPVAPAPLGIALSVPAAPAPPLLGIALSAPVAPPLLGIALSVPANFTDQTIAKTDKMRCGYDSELPLGNLKFDKVGIYWLYS